MASPMMPSGSAGVPPSLVSALLPPASSLSMGGRTGAGARGGERETRRPRRGAAPGAGGGLALDLAAAREGSERSEGCADGTRASAAAAGGDRTGLAAALAAASLSPLPDALRRRGAEAGAAPPPRPPPPRSAPVALRPRAFGRSSRGGADAGASPRPLLGCDTATPARCRDPGVCAVRLPHL